MAESNFFKKIHFRCNKFRRSHVIIIESALKKTNQNIFHGLTSAGESEN